MTRPIIFSIILFIAFISNGQTSKIYTSDIDNYWVAYDSVINSKDLTKQIDFIQKLYIDKASEGLKEFIADNNNTAELYVKNILDFPKFWKSIRPKTLNIKSYVNEINEYMLKYKELYPNFKQPVIFFTIGCLNSGGRPGIGKVLIGAEIACADKTIDASELDSWLQSVFQDNKDLIYLVLHEAGHTQQKEEDENSNLLEDCIQEGACDFLTELLMQKEIISPYMTFGKTNEKKVWIVFQKEMFGKEKSRWLYNGSQAPKGQADIGYFIGYVICKSYYENSKNKKKAIKEIIELEMKPKKVLKFLEKSKYNGGEK